MTRAERRQKPRDRQVLVVDDEPDIRELLELTLLKMGLDVDERRHRSPRRRSG